MSYPSQLRLGFGDTPPKEDVSFAAWKGLAKGMAEKASDPIARLHLAQAFCGSTLTGYWQQICKESHCPWDIRTPPIPFEPLDPTAFSIARDAGVAAAGLPFLHAGYVISSFYTAMLPEKTRSELGAYYTPPALAERLMDMVTEAGFDWEKGRVLDPACGGGAFLAHAALRMKKIFTTADPVFVLRNITTRLHGFEIDPFAAWLSQILLEAALLDICREANKRLPDVVLTANALSIPVETQRSYDLVVGNPPYGKITLPEEQRRQYKRSLYGHANLYGLFTDLALRWVRPGGIIGYVTPTSFLGGQYFKELRRLLLNEAPPVKMDFVTERQGVFEDVLQETVLSVFKRSGKRRRTVSVDFLRPNGNERQVSVWKAGKYDLPVQGGEPWLLPRERTHLALLKKAASMPHRLSDYGFSISTGQLVWNRHKKQLKNDRGNGCYPLVWAESVTAEGVFNFSAVRRNHQPYLHVYAGQEYLVTKKSCVLVQRTTAKEQKRRLIAALLPQEFIEKHGGVVVENHLNMIRSSEDKPPICPKVITAILNTKTLDFVFRCISGSVAVSAFELNALPMPSPEQMKTLERLLQLGTARDEIETTVARIYGVE
jgi:adenine-specific DNA-methyltransferase